MTLRQQLCKLLCPPEEPEIPFTTLRHRSGQHIRNVLKRQFPSAHVRVADMDYSAPTRTEFDAWLLEDQVSIRAYHPEWYDCDDFARALRCEMLKIGQDYKTTFTIAYCEGYVMAAYHAYNLMIDDKDAIYIIEPQNDSVVPIAKSKYRTDFIQL
jgi:hypothetical protein